VGNGVTVGHLALLHGCTIGDNTLIGMHSTIMNGVVIGKNCVIGAGSLITTGTVIPDGSVALGSPAKVIRSIKSEEIEYNKFDAEFYRKQASSYKSRS
jgi:carbonic anhydrase/acetyltransferase-like protein (isoleucine patch superfamily)